MHLMDVMTLQSAYTSPDAKLADASALLAEHDCGVLPVVDRDELRVVGMITDRDICLTFGKQPKRSASEIPVREAMTEAVFACRPEEKPSEALETMRKHAVRRLPVVEATGRLGGILTLDDIARAARIFEDGGSSRALYTDVALTMKAIHP